MSCNWRFFLLCCKLMVNFLRLDPLNEYDYGFCCINYKNTHHVEWRSRSPSRWQRMISNEAETFEGAFIDMYLPLFQLSIFPSSWLVSFNWSMWMWTSSAVWICYLYGLTIFKMLVADMSLDRWMLFTILCQKTLARNPFEDSCWACTCYRYTIGFII